MSDWLRSLARPLDDFELRVYAGLYFAGLALWLGAQFWQTNDLERNVELLWRRLPW